MLIHRSERPSTLASAISTLGASGSWGRATTAPRDRAVRRRRGLGRFGTGTSRLVAQHGSHSTTDSTRVPDRSVHPGFRSVGAGWYGGRHIAGHIQRGGGTGPMKPRQPPTAHAVGTVPIPDRCGRRLPDKPPPRNRRRFFHGSYESEVSRVSGGVRARGAVCLRPLLRAARGRLRPRRPGRRPRPAPPPHPGRPAEHLALRGLPAARKPARSVRARLVANRSD